MSTSRGGEPLAELETQLVEVQQVPKVQKIERRFNRRSQVVVVLSLIIALLSMAWSGYLSMVTAETTRDIAVITTRATVNEKDIRDLREANKLRAEAGLPQIPLPEPGEDVDIRAIAAAASAIVLEDIQGDPRFRGDPGSTGAKGKDGKPCNPSDPACKGPKGDTGVKGQDAPPVTAQAILDGIAAFCSQASQPCTGDTGPAGANGQNGTNGVNGAQGASVVAVTTEGDIMTCEFVFYAQDPASGSGEPYVIGRVKAPAQSCAGEQEGGN